jgi:phage tail protein, P2 protein I family
MIKLHDSEITQILPLFLKQQSEVQAIGYAVKRANQRVIDYCKNISLHATIDTLPDNILDVLAMELRTQYYDENMPIDRKRKLVKNTLFWYQKAGTKEAVEELIDLAFNDGKIVEWFEVGGVPGTFDIETNTQFTEEAMKMVAESIKDVKNTRSHLNGIRTGKVYEFGVKFGGVIVSSNEYFVDGKTKMIPINIDDALSVGCMVVLEYDYLIEEGL